MRVYLILCSTLTFVQRFTGASALANVSKLLYSTVEDECFLVNIDADKSLLTEAKQKVRKHLRETFSLFGQATFGFAVSPKFFTQGSCAYGTLNDPAWPPKQQKDLDYGCYLPLSFVRGSRPSAAAALFFEFVDAALKKLAKIEGWTHQQRPTCSRVVIGLDAHIDVPLYAIPDKDFKLLERKAMDARADSATAKKHDVWEALPSDVVLLAHREEDWIESDPRKIHNWFQEAVGIYGPRLRRDCRYLKAWRDHNKLDDCHLSSILLMACVWTAYETIRGPFLSEREDERLLQLVERLSGYLRGVVENPACAGENLNRMSDAEKTRVISSVESLEACLRQTIRHCDDERNAVDLVTRVLGSRIPDRIDFVVTAPAVIATIMAQPKRVVAAPEVGRSISG
jgi:hypothetical protein